MSYAGSQNAQISDVAAIEWFKLQNPGVPLGPGKTFFVYNNASVPGATYDGTNFVGPFPASSTVPAGGSDTAKGTYQNPIRTLYGAFLRTVSGRGDNIILLPGHKEYLEDGSASAVARSINGNYLNIVGWGGSRSALPTIYFGRGTGAANAAGTQILFGGTGAQIRNVAFVNVSIGTGITKFMRVSGTGNVVSSCFFDMAGDGNQAGQVGTAIDLVTSGGNYTVIDNCEVISNAPVTGQAIQIALAATNVQISNCRIRGPYSVAAISLTAAALLNRISDCRITNTTASTSAIKSTSASASGDISHCTVNCPNAAAATKTAIDIGSSNLWYLNQNYGSDGVGQVSGVLNPVVDS